MKLSALAIATALFSGAVFAAPLTLQTYNPQEKGLFAVNSTLVSGPHEAVLFDAQFSVKDGEKLVEMIRKNSSRKNMMSLSEAVYTSAIPVLRLSIFIALRAITVEHPRTADRPDSLQSLVHRHIHLQHDFVDPAVQQ